MDNTKESMFIRIPHILQMDPTKQGKAAYPLQTLRYKKSLKVWTELVGK